MFLVDLVAAVRRFDMEGIYAVHVDMFAVAVVHRCGLEGGLRPSCWCARGGGVGIVFARVSLVGASFLIVLFLLRMLI